MFSSDGCPRETGSLLGDELHFRDIFDLDDTRFPGFGDDDFFDFPDIIIPRIDREDMFVIVDIDVSNRERYVICLEGIVSI